MAQTELPDSSSLRPLLLHAYLPEVQQSTVVHWPTGSYRPESLRIITPNASAMIGFACSGPFTLSQKSGSVPAARTSKLKNGQQRRSRLIHCAASTSATKLLSSRKA